jgi:hypothetical protein
MDFNQLPKIRLDQWSFARMDKDIYMLLGIQTGNDARAYLVHPQAAKGLYDTLGKELKKYEDEHGEIDMTGYAMGIPSPLQ